MAVESNNDGIGLNRRNFLKNAGVAVAGGTLAAGLKLTPEAAAAAAVASAPTTITNFRCPICAKDFGTYGGLKSHFGTAHPGSVLPVTTRLKVNGKDYDVLIEPHWTLQRTLQFKLGLTGAKQMCDRGVCGSCTVIIDGKAVLSCSTLAVECEGKAIETVEGIAADKKWNSLIQSYCKWDAMQCGYCTPGFVVSAKALLDKNPNPTEEQCKQALAGNICCCGTYPRHPTAIMEAAQIMKGARSMADTVGVNGDRKEFKVVGKPNLPGKLSYSIATGMAKFGADYVFPEMLHAKFLRSPYANAAVKSVDVAAAKKIPGVVDVLTWEDEELKNFGRRGGGMGFGAPAGPYIGNTANMEDEEVGVIVVAETEELCDEALKALNPQWDVRPHVVDILEGRKPNAPVIRPNAGGGGGMGSYTMGGGPQNPPPKGNVTYSIASRGDIEAGFKEADQIIEYDFNMPAFCGHIPNPPASVAYWYDDPRYDPEKQSLRIEGAVWTASQGKDAVGGMYGLPPEKVWQEGLFQGGRYCDWGFRKTQEITPLLAKRVGRPVRMTLTRSQMYDFNMNQRFVHLKVGFKKNGLITAIDDFSIADAGVPPVSTLGTSGDQGYGPYFTTRCLNIKQSMEVVNSNRGKMYTSGQHCPFNWDSLTMALHLIAEKLGKDPIDIATLNLHGPTDYTDPNPVPSYQACVEAGRKLMNWNWHATGAKKLPDGRMHGASFRYQFCPRHSFSSYNSKLELRNGKVHMGTQGCCTGIYAVEGNAMVVAEELGLKYEDISIDFDYKEPFAPVGGGSDGTTASAWVTKECANLLKKQILEAAINNANNPPAAGGFGFGPPPPAAAPSPLKGFKPDDLDIQDGKIFVKSDPSKSVPFARATEGSHLFATFSGKPPTALWATGMGKYLDTMNIAMCEVAVDAETGEVEILRFGVVADPGKVIRQTSLESQIHQVMDFSAGCQLSEDYFYDKATGVKLNANMFDYKKVSMLDMPRVDMKLLETRVGNAAYGSNGISHSLANTHLVVCAIQNAIGKWVDPPATPDKVLKALGKA